AAHRYAIDLRGALDADLIADCEVLPVPLDRARQRHAGTHRNRLGGLASGRQLRKLEGHVHIGAVDEEISRVVVTDEIVTKDVRRGVRRPLAGCMFIYVDGAGSVAERIVRNRKIPGRRVDRTTIRCGIRRFERVDWLTSGAIVLEHFARAGVVDEDMSVAVNAQVMNGLKSGELPSELASRIGEDVDVARV